jgi:tetratricopeptide (TPR) repeat protein
MPAPVKLRYRAFISYSHADTKWANWLHGRLEGFRVGSDLIGRETPMGPIPKTLRPIFRDRDDFTAGHSLSEQTLAALDASAALIVLGSPDGAKSHYVNEEVRLFKHRHPDRPITPIILAGKQETRERDRLAREETRDKQLKAEIVQSLLGIGGAQAAPGAAKAVGDAVAEAQEGAAQGDERLQKALDLLKANKPQDAEPLFRTVAEEKAARVRTDRARLEKDSKAAAAAYRNLGAIAGLGDPKRAREAYAKALEYDGDDPEAFYWYGYLNFLAGDLDTAQRTLVRLLETSTARGDQRGIYRAHLVQGRTMQGRGSLPSAFEHLERSRGIALAESTAANDDFEWQRDVSEAQIRIGDVLQDQGNLSAALDSYKAAHAIRERLAAADPGNAGWQLDFSVSHEKIGDVLRAQGNLPAALDSYKSDLAIMERLAAADPGNAGWQRDLSVSHNKIGDVLRDHGNLPAALDIDDKT